MWLYVEFCHATTVYPMQNGVTAPNGEWSVRLPNGLLYPRVEVVQQTHSGDEIAATVDLQQLTKVPLKSFNEKKCDAVLGLIATH